MNYRYLCFLTFALLLFACQDKQRPTSDSPNIVIILADDLGYGALSCYGNPYFETPHIDQMARKGMKFAQFYSQSPVCSPARAALLSGRYPHEVGVSKLIRPWDYQNSLDNKVPNLASELSSLGYKTGVFGKWHLGNDSVQHHPFAYGFDTFWGFQGKHPPHNLEKTESHKYILDGKTPTKVEGYITDLITDQAVQFIKQNKQQPFFAYLPYVAIHKPYTLKKGTQARKIPDLPTGYAEALTSLDENVGKILTTLDGLGLQENTLVFFFSDHGGLEYIPLNNGLKLGKGFLTEGGVRIPAIAYWPGHIKPGISNEVGALMDIMPTCLSIAKKRPIAQVDGIDLSPHLLQGVKMPARTLFWQLGEVSALRAGHWKLIYRNKIRFEDEKGKIPRSQARWFTYNFPVEKVKKLNINAVEADSLVEADRLDNPFLFNLIEDAGEQNNLADAYPDILNALWERLNRWENTLPK